MTTKGVLEVLKAPEELPRSELLKLALDQIGQQQALSAGELRIIERVQAGLAGLKGESLRQFAALMVMRFGESRSICAHMLRALYHDSREADDLEADNRVQKTLSAILLDEIKAYDDARKARSEKAANRSSEVRKERVQPKHDLIVKKARELLQAKMGKRDLASKLQKRGLGSAGNIRRVLRKAGIS